MAADGKRSLSRACFGMFSNRFVSLYLFISVFRDQGAAFFGCLRVGQPASPLAGAHPVPGRSLWPAG